MALGLGLGLPFSKPVAGESFVGVLDLFPNAVTAVSLSRLRSGYTGPLVRVRRSSDNAEQDIGYLADGNLDVAGMLSFCGAGNGFVTRWYDQSTTAPVDFSQGTASAQPTIVSSGSYNSLGMFFDGSNDELNGGATPITSNHTGQFSVFSINQCANTEAGYILSWALSAQGSALYANNPSYDLRNGIAGGDSITKTNSQNMVAAYYNNSDVKWRLNGSDLVDATPTTYNFNSSTANLVIGNRTGGSSAGTRFNGYIKEIFLYNIDKRTDRVAFMNNRNAFWSVY